MSAEFNRVLSQYHRAMNRAERMMQTINELLNERHILVTDPDSEAAQAIRENHLKFMDEQAKRDTHPAEVSGDTPAPMVVLP